MTRNGRRVRDILLMAITSLLWLGVSAPGMADPEPVAAGVPSALAAVDVGIQGLYKTGHWTAVRIRLQKGAVDTRQPVSLLVPDSEGITASYAGELQSGTASPTHDYAFLVRPGQINPVWDLSYTPESGARTLLRIPADQLPRAQPSGSQVVLSIGSDLQLAAALGLRSAAARDRVETRHLSTAEAMPRHWLAYSGVDQVFVTTQPEWIETVEAVQWQAMRRWVEMGGNLCVSANTQRESLFRDTGPLAWTVGAQIRGTATMRQTTNLEQFAAASRRLDRSAPGESAESSLTMFVLESPQGQVEFREGLSEESVPAILRRTAGFGRITFLNFSLDAAPLASWTDRPRLLARVLDYGLDAPLDDQATGGEGGPTTHLGFTDLTGQLRIALEQFPQVRFMPFSWIAALALAYLACIGPLDYWLLRRSRRLTWTWITSLGVVLAFTAAFLYLSTQRRSPIPLVNQVSIVDFDAQSGLVRGTIWSHLYSPQTAVQDLRLKPESFLEFTEPFESVLNWQGLPGNGFGGIDRSDAYQGFTSPYRVVTNASPPDQANGELRNFPIAIWASRSVSGQWWAKVQPSGDSTLNAGSESLLRGTVRNPLPVDLRNAYLVYDRWAYPLGTISAGMESSVDESMAIDLQTVLTDRRIVDGRSVTPAWDRQSTDIARIIQSLLFYAAAKGQQYTGLQHRHQRFLDWSDHVRLGQATLWGRAHRPFTRLQSSANPTVPAEDWTFCRTLIPVRDAKRGQP